MLHRFGVNCDDCAGDGEYCVDIRFHAGLMSPDTDEFPDDPPDCGGDLEEAEIGPSSASSPTSPARWPSSACLA